MPPKGESELEVDRLKRESLLEILKVDYSNWKLKDVPFAVIWNVFSRSNWKLDEF